MSWSPSGAQVELAERVGVPALADELLRTPPVGRGRPDPRGDEVSAAELLRVAVGFLAARLAAATPVVEPPHRRSVRDRWSRRHRPYVVVGRSLSAEVVRRALAAAGGREGGRKPVAVLVGDDLTGLVQGRWTRAVRTGSGQRWRRAWSVLEARDDVGLLAPPAPSPASRETHLLLLPPGDAVRCTAELVGLSVGPAALPDHYDPARVDLLRRVHQALATRLTRAERVRVAPILDAWSPARAAYRLGPPPEHAEWARVMGERLATRLADPPSGVTVHGDPALVVPSCDVTAPRTVPASAALDRALAAIRASAVEEPA